MAEFSAPSGLLAEPWVIVNSGRRCAWRRAGPRGFETRRFGKPWKLWEKETEDLATNFTAQPSRNQIKKPITCTSTTTCTYFVDVDLNVLVDGCCHLQICFQKVKDFRPSNTNYTKQETG